MGTDRFEGTPLGFRRGPMVGGMGPVNDGKGRELGGVGARES